MVSNQNAAKKTSDLKVKEWPNGIARQQEAKNKEKPKNN